MQNSRDHAPRIWEKAKKNQQKKGLVIIHSGDGKGKTTAAFGTALRALGRGQKVAVLQFLKGKWKTGEMEAAKQFGDSLKVVAFGKGFTWETKSFEDDKRLAEEAWEKCLEFLNDEIHQLVIFDEILYVLKYGFLDVSTVSASIKKKPPLKHVILTGRDVPPEILKIADLVTEMKCVKHPYHCGVPAQPGIEF